MNLDDDPGGRFPKIVRNYDVTRESIEALSHLKVFKFLVEINNTMYLFM